MTSDPGNSAPAPINHEDWLRSLDRQQRAQLTEKSDRLGLQHLLVHVGCIGVVSCLILIPTWPLWVLLPLMLIQGVLLVFLFTLQHETSHYTPFKTRQLNTWVGYACGLLLLLPPIWFRYFHLAHHRWTQNPAKDPELQSPKPDTRLRYLLYLSGLPLWKSLIQTLLRNASGRCNDTFVPARRQPAIRIESLLMLSVYIVAMLWSVTTGRVTELLIVWVIPLLLGQPLLRAYLLAEHADCPEVDNRFANTRTLLTHPLVRRLAWNMPYHTEHHAYPAVPFFRLPQAHALARAHLQQVEPGYQSFHRRFYQRVSR